MARNVFVEGRNISRHDGGRGDSSELRNGCRGSEVQLPQNALDLVFDNPRVVEHN